MTSLDELKTLGFTMTFSSSCPIVNSGGWFVGLVKSEGNQIHGYGTDETSALYNALKIAQNRALTK